MPLEMLQFALARTSGPLMATSILGFSATVFDPGHCGLLDGSACPHSGNPQREVALDRFSGMRWYARKGVPIRLRSVPG